MSNKTKKKNKKPLSLSTAITILCIIVLPTIVVLLFTIFSKQWIPRTYLARYMNQMYNKDTEVVLDRSYYQTTNTIVTLDSITTDRYNLAEDLTQLPFIEKLHCQDKENQSDYVIAGDNIYGVVVRNKEIYALIETTSQEMLGCFIVADSEENYPKYMQSPTDEMKDLLAKLDSSKVKYEGIITKDNQKLNVFRVIESNDTETILYMSAKTHRLVRTIRIEDKIIQVADIKENTEPVYFFNEMLTFQNFSLIDHETFSDIYEKFEFYAITTSNLSDFYQEDSESE